MTAREHYEFLTEDAATIYTLARLGRDGAIRNAALAAEQDADGPLGPGPGAYPFPASGARRAAAEKRLEELAAALEQADRAAGR